jgi:hypothetical protein
MWTIDTVFSSDEGATEMKLKLKARFNRSDARTITTVRCNEREVIIRREARMPTRQYEVRSFSR